MSGAWKVSQLEFSKKLEINYIALSISKAPLPQHAQEEYHTIPQTSLKRVHSTTSDMCWEHFARMKHMYSYNGLSGIAVESLNRTSLSSSDMVPSDSNVLSCVKSCVLGCVYIVYIPYVWI